MNSRRTTPTAAFERHPLSDSEKVWLAEAYRVDPQPIAVRATKARLYRSLGGNFDPRRIDRRFFIHPKLTLLGKWRASDGQAPIFQWIHAFITSNRDWLLEHPESPSISGDEFRRRSKLTDWQTRETLSALRELHEHYNLGRFYSGHADKVDGVQRIAFEGDDALDEYLVFENMPTLLDRAYVRGQVDQHHARLIREFESQRNTGEERTQVARDTKPTSALILMAMRPDDSILEEVHHTIKQVCLLFGVEAYRVDEVGHSASITTLLLERLRTADLIIADLTYERPNVYYEIGYVHALRKHPILFRKKGTPLHFDLSVHKVPEWANTVELHNALAERLRSILGREPIGIKEITKSTAKKTTRAPKRRSTAA